MKMHIMNDVSQQKPYFAWISYPRRVYVYVNETGIYCYFFSFIKVATTIIIGKKVATSIILLTFVYGLSGRLLFHRKFGFFVGANAR